MRRSLFALVVRDDDASVVVYLSTLRRSNPIILVHFSPPKCILWYVSFRFYSVFFFLNAEQRERNNHRFLITSAFVVVQTTARGKSFLLSFSDEANSNARRIESLGKRFEFSLFVSLIPYEKALSSLRFFLSLLSRAREKNYSFQTPLLLLVFVVVLVVLLLKNTTTTTNWEREKE